MLGGEDGAAVLIGENGGFQRADFPGNGDDFLFVHTDQGHENRHIHHGTGDGHGLHGLRGHLAQVFAGDESAAAVFPGKALGDLHHKPPHDQGEVFLGAVVPDGLLNLRKGDDVHGHFPAVAGDQSCQLQDFVLGQLGGIGIGEEVHGFNLHAPLGHHIGGDRGVDAAGEQAHGPSAHTGGQAACAGQGRSVDIGGKVPHLHIDRVGRVVHIHGHTGMGLCQSSADLLGDGNGAHGELLVRPLGFHLKRGGAVQLIAQICFNGRKDGIHVFLTGAAAADAVHAEDALAGFPCTLNVRFLVLRLHVNRGLENIYVKVAVGLHSAPDILAQLILKLPLVGALENDLAQLQKKNFVHMVSLPGGSPWGNTANIALLYRIRL